MRQIGIQSVSCTQAKLAQIVEERKKGIYLSSYKNDKQKTFSGQKRGWIKKRQIKSPERKIRRHLV